MRRLAPHLAPLGYSPRRYAPLSPASVLGMAERLTDLRDIQQMFTNGESGGYWPADPAYAYEDSAGTTKASQNGVVGLRYDVSKGLALGPELITNGNFNDGSGWTLYAGVSIIDGTLNFNTSSNQSANCNTTGYVAGTAYVVSFNLISRTSGSPYVNLGGTVYYFPELSPGYYQYIVIPTGTPATYFAFHGGFFGSGGVCVVDNISVRSLSSNAAIQATTANKPYLRRTPTTNKPWYDANTATGALNVTFASALGSACTIATVTPEGVSILENQTVGTTYNICPPYGYNSDVLIINRALTPAEKALVTRVMQRSVPGLGSNLAVNGSFATDTDWTKGTGWSIDAVATKSAGTASNLTQTLGVSGNQYRVTADITRTAGTVGAYNGTTQIGATAATETAAKYAMKTTSTTVGFRGDASFAGTVDNAVIQEIL